MGRTRSQEFLGSRSLTTRTQAWVEFRLISAFSPSFRPFARRPLGYTPHHGQLHTYTSIAPAFIRPGGVCLFAGNRSVQKSGRCASRSVHNARPGSEFNHTNTVGLPVLIPPPPSRPVSLAPPSPQRDPPAGSPSPIPRVPGWGGGEAGTAPRPHGRPSEPEAEGAQGGAGHRPAGPTRAGPGLGAGLPWPPAGRGQPGERGIVVCPGEALLPTPPWAD